MSTNSKVIASATAATSSHQSATLHLPEQNQYMVHHKLEFSLPEKLMNHKHAQVKSKIIRNKTRQIKQKK